MTPLTAALIFLSGVLAGVLGTAGGITSLVSYPGLLLAGLSPYAANVTNLVSLVATWPSSAVASRQELRAIGRGGWLLLLPSAVGCAAGTALLLTTPTALFDWVIPGLVLVSAVVLIAQPGISRWRTRRAAAGHPTHPRGWSMTWVALVSVYGGYFGGGRGVMLLTVCLVLVDGRFPIANATKNMLVGVGALTSAAIVVSAVDIDWPVVVAMSGGLFVGGLIGPRIARRLPSRVVRWSVAGLGIMLAGQLILRQL